MFKSPWNQFRLIYYSYALWNMHNSSLETAQSSTQYCQHLDSKAQVRFQPGHIPFSTYLSLSFFFFPCANWKQYLCHTYFISEIISEISESFSKSLTSIISEICTMLCNFQRLYVHYFLILQGLPIISISQMRNTKLLTVKGFSQPHTDSN